MHSSPGWPSGTALPASSRSSASVDGIGRPIEPLYAGKSSGLIVAAGDVSVSPYASISGEPVTSFHRNATASCTAMPPPSVRRKVEKSSFANSALLMSALKSVLTPVNAVKRNLLISFTKPAMSRGFGISTFSPPTVMNTRQFAVSEKM